MRKQYVWGLAAVLAALPVWSEIPGSVTTPAFATASADPCLASAPSSVAIACKPGNDATLHPYTAAYGRHGQEADYVLMHDGHVPAAGAAVKDPLLTATSQMQSLSVEGGVWSSVGPAPIAYPGSTSTDAGRVLSLAYAPSTGSLFAGTADGGVWRTTDGGSTWSPLTDSMPSLAINALAIDPNNPQIMFAGTGEGSYCGDCLDGVGVYKSTDGGSTWTLYGNNVFQRNVVTSIVVDPSNSNNVYAAELSRSGGSLGVAVSGDGGQSWTDPTGTALSGVDVTSLAIDNAGDIYAATTYGSTNGVYVSADHGQSWSNVSNGLPTSSQQFKVALAPSSAGGPLSSQILYAIAGGGNKIVGVYRSTNGGASWSQIAPASVAEGFEEQAWYDIYIAVDPRDTSGNTVYFGLSAIYRTTNALASSPSWTDLTCDVPGCNSVVNMHPDQHAIAFAGSRTYFGNDGGVFMSASGGNPPYPSANGNLAITQFYGGAAGVGATAARLLGGTQDNGTVQTDGTGWFMQQGGDGGHTAIDPTSGQNMYGEFLGNDPPLATHDGGASWSQELNGLPLSDNTLWVAPLVMDPTSPQVLYQGRTHLFRSADGENSWTDISASVSPGTALSAVAVAPTDPNTIYMADLNGHSWVTHNLGSTWTSLDGSSCDPAHPSPYYCANAGITSIAVDPTNAQTVYVTMNGIEGAQEYHVFKSTDGGTTWSDISTQLPDIAFQSIAVDPVSPNTLFAGADLGVYVSHDAGASWSLLGSGLPNARVFQVVPSADGSSVVAFTHGRSAWRIALVAGGPPTIAFSTAAPTAAYGSRLSFTATASGAAVTWVSITGLPVGFTHSAFPAPGAGPKTVTIAGSGPNGDVTAVPGTYVATFTVSDGVDPPVSQPLTITVTKQRVSITPGGSSLSANPIAPIGVASSASVSGTLSYTATVREAWFGASGSIPIDTATPFTVTLTRVFGNGSGTTPTPSCLATLGTASSVVGGTSALIGRCSVARVPVGVYDVHLAIAGTSPYFTGSYDMVLTVGNLTGANAFKEYGGGALTLPAGVTANVGFLATACSTGTTQNPVGGFVYVEHRAGGDVVVTGGAGSFATCALSSTTPRVATLTGSAARSDSPDPMSAVLTASGAASLAPGGKVGLTVTDNGVATDIGFSPIALRSGSRVVVG